MQGVTASITQMVSIVKDVILDLTECFGHQVPRLRRMPAKVRDEKKCVHSPKDGLQCL